MDAHRQDQSPSGPAPVLGLDATSADLGCDARWRIHLRQDVLAHLTVALRLLVALARAMNSAQLFQQMIRCWVRPRTGFSLLVELNVRVFAISEIIIDIDLCVVIVCRYCISYLAREKPLTGLGWRLVRGHSHGTGASVNTNCATVQVSRDFQS